jgi:hypothetical protein
MTGQATTNVFWKGHNEGTRAMVTVYRDSRIYVEKYVLLFENNLWLNIFYKESGLYLNCFRLFSFLFNGDD